VLLAAFALLGPATPVWAIATLTFCYGGFAGLQYTAMNTLIYHDLDIAHASMASSMASTVQYLAMSFGIALSTLLMQALLQGHERADYVEAFRWTVLLLALVTAAASRVFGRLRHDRPLSRAGAAAG
jgi:hypothetical protein